MRPASVEERLRRFLLAVAAFIFVGTVVELWFVEHIGDTVQIVPFVLCALGLIAVLAAWYAPRRGVLRLLQGVMVTLVLGTGFGLYEHLAHNIAFEQEIRPSAGLKEVFGGALGGASPLLAPGILALGAILAFAATYRHPALAGAREEEENALR